MPRPLASAQTARVIHRYLGFFLAGIMAVYAISGTVLIFRSTNFLKRATHVSTTVAPGLVGGAAIGEALEIRRLNIERTEGELSYFKDGNYNSLTGKADYLKWELPPALAKMTHLHKATTDDPLFVLNIAFGVSLLLFVVTAFWMYMPGGTILRRGLWFTAGGIALTVVLLWQA